MFTLRSRAGGAAPCEEALEDPTAGASVNSAPIVGDNQLRDVVRAARGHGHLCAPRCVLDRIVNQNTQDLSCPIGIGERLGVSGGSQLDL